MEVDKKRSRSVKKNSRMETGKVNKSGIHVSNHTAGKNDSVQSPYQQLTLIVWGLDTTDCFKRVTDIDAQNVYNNIMEILLLSELCKRN